MLVCPYFCVRILFEEVINIKLRVPTIIITHICIHTHFQTHIQLPVTVMAQKKKL